jgi:hypothetical protein
MKDVILLNNLFNGEYIKEKVGGEIINLFQSDNNKYYIYVNPYGNINKKWDDRIKHILFIRSVGNGVVKIIGKAEIEKQISHNAIRKTDTGIDDYQKQYINKNNITYGNVKIDELGSWSNYFMTFEAKTVFKAKTDIYLTTNENHTYPSDSTFVLEDIKKINNQSQKLYIEPNNENYNAITKYIIENPDFWESVKVGKVNLSSINKTSESFLSIVKKENDELVNSNLLAYFLEKDKEFWSDFVEKVLEISDDNVINSIPKITRENIGNIDILIEVGEFAIIIENKIKSGINGRKKDGYSQLEKYVDVANEYFKVSNRTLYFYLLRPNYNNEDYTAFNKGNRYKEIKYSKIYNIIKNRNSGLFFEEFKKVVKKHSAEYDNELFELMNDRFIQQIRSRQIVKNAHRP